MIIEIIVSLFILAGSLLMLIAGIGVIRMPDIYMRIHVSTKPTSLGIMLLLFGSMIYYPAISVIIKSFAIIVFLYLTIPVAAYLLGKTSLEMKSYLWSKKKNKK